MMIIQYLAELMKKKVLLTSEMQGFQHVRLLSHREAAKILLSGYSAEHESLIRHERLEHTRKLLIMNMK